MSDFLAALGLVFIIEGLVFAAFPEAAKTGHDQRAENAGCTEHSYFLRNRWLEWVEISWIFTKQRLSRSETCRLRKCHPALPALSQPEPFRLSRPFGRRYAQICCDADAAGEPTSDRDFDQTRSNEGQRDRHVNVTNAAFMAAAIFAVKRTARRHSVVRRAKTDVLVHDDPRTVWAQ
jgi:hypothetical protein